jgi:hypothetical protein
MASPAYNIGDHVFLVQGPLKTGRAEGEFTIVARLPDVHGTVQFRVKSIGENFERRIVSSDIDLDRSPKPRTVKEKPQAVAYAKESWLKTSTIKVSK